MTFHFAPAKLEGVGLFIAIAGGSRTGKTYTALRLAKGIAGTEGRIAAIDTEGKRMSHYSNEFKFDVFNLKSPFSPIAFANAAKGAEDAGYACLVIDSFSLEWSGIGGVLDMYDDHFAKVGFNQKQSDVCWSRAKKPHKAMLNELIQCTIPIVFCLRANEVPKHLAGFDGAWKVDQDKRFLYEWTVSLTLHPDTPGKPRFDLVDAFKKPLWKVQDQHRHLFPPDAFIGEDAGAALQAWRNSAAARASGSAAVERKRTFADWLAELEEALSVASTHEAVEARVGRDDVQKTLENGSDVQKQRVNALVLAALERVRGGPAPDSVPANAGAEREKSDA